MSRKRKIIIHISAWIFFIAAIVVTLAFSYSETTFIKCSEIAVHYAGDQTVQLGKQEIIRMVSTADINIVGTRLSNINTHIIEQEVEKHSAVMKADAYKMILKDTTQFKGVIALRVTHRTPVLRVITNEASYYIDKEGARFPTSTRYSANVIVVTGNVTEELARHKILPFVQYLGQDRFWQAQIKQIHVDRNEELLLTPLLGSQIIEFGTVENYPVKLRNLMAFYEHVLSKDNWNRYERISLKFNNQIVAKILK
jgi:cell division protein FtsQ